MSKLNVAIIFCAEKGILETQARLLINSINKFSSFHHLQLFAVSPRKDFLPEFDLQNYFESKSVIHIKENLNLEYLDYPIANKVLACEYIEQNYPEFDSVMFVDTDTIFLNPLDDQLLNNEKKLCLRPVDNKGPGSEGENDNNDAFWKDVYGLFELPIPKANLSTTVRPNTIRPYYNAGFIWAHKLPGFFTQWKQDFVKLVDSGLRPFGYQSRDNTDFRCLDQVALAITSQRFLQNVKLLPETYNYPIPFRPMMQDRDHHPNFNNLVHIHYHKWFQHAGFLDHVTNEEDKKTEQYLWLKNQLPLQPEIFADFKC